MRPRDNRMRIGLDVDGVLADFIGAFREIAQDVLHKPCQGPSGNWHFDKWGLTKEDVQKVWDKIEKISYFWEDLPLLSDVNVGDLKRLNRIARLFFITSRSAIGGQPVELQTAWWLNRKFNLIFPTVLVTDGSKEKGELAYALKLDYFIDDKRENCIDVVHCSPNTRVFVRDMSYNQDLGDYAEVITRVHSFDDFIKEVNFGATNRS